MSSDGKLSIRWIWPWLLLAPVFHCIAASPQIATSTAGTDEHVIVEASSGPAAALATAFPGRLRKIAAPQSAFQLNNVFVEPPRHRIAHASGREGAEAERPILAFANFPANPAQVAAPTPDRAQDTQGGSLVAAVPPAATGESLRCGARTATTLTVCLNRQRALDALDRIAVLAFTQDPSVAYVEGDAERTVLKEVLADLPHRLEIADSSGSGDQTQPGERAGRILLVRKP